MEVPATARRLLPHQERGVVHGLTAVNAANFSVPGSGKTATTLAIATTHLASGTIDCVIVVGPLACFRPWENECQAALPSGLRPRRIRGTEAQRRKLYGTVRRGDLVLVSYASAAADRIALIELCKVFGVMLVVDEAHRIKRFRGGLWAPALMEIARHARVRFILTGTPMPQSGRDLYSQLNVLWPDGDLTGPRDDFAVKVDRDFGSVLEATAPFMSRTPKSELKLPSYVLERHEVELASIQAEIYDLIESNFRRRLKDASSWSEKLDALRRGRPIRLLQASANPDLLNRVDSYYHLKRVEVPAPSLMERLASYRGSEIPAKSEYASNLLRPVLAAGQKVVCWSNFVPNLDQFAELVRSRFQLPCFQIDGRVAAADETMYSQEGGPQPDLEDTETRETIIERFLDTEGAAVLVTNPASCSESISLHRSCHTAIYLDRTYDCGLYLQSIDRIHRLGLPNGVQVRIHLLLARCKDRPTIDHLVDASLLRKEATMLQLLQGAELAPFALAEDPLDAAEGSEEDLAQLLKYLLGEGS